jgi:hypothetical protein
MLVIDPKERARIDLVCTELYLICTKLASENAPQVREEDIRGPVFLVREDSVGGPTRHIVLKLALTTNVGKREDFIYRREGHLSIPYRRR